MANTYVEKLQRAVIKKQIILVISGSLLFTLGFLLLLLTYYERSAVRNANDIEDSYLSICKTAEEFLNNDKTVGAALESIRGLGNQSMDIAENAYMRNCFISQKLIVADDNGKICYSTFSEKELSDYLRNYNYAIAKKAEDTGEIYSSVYFETGKRSNYMFVKPVYQNKSLEGYISVFVMGDEWAYYLSDMNSDGVIFDKNRNILYQSKKIFSDKVGKYVADENKIETFRGEQYWAVYRKLQDRDVTVCGMVYIYQNYNLLIGLIIIFLNGFASYRIAKAMGVTMAKNNSKQIEALVKEIRFIQDGYYNHRIHMNTKDEFDEVGHRINRMLDAMKELLEANMRIEISQLEAQMNPHFLYNTLEIIRNLVVIDGEEAQKMIAALTEILRYSVDSSFQNVHLDEDMEYIQTYVYIQKKRFGDRFECNFDFENACNSCVIPKLLLQPIIENSIKYGFKKQDFLKIRISGKLEDNTLCIHVKDNGEGISVEEARDLTERINSPEEPLGGKGLGLHNIARRLALQYGKDSQIIVDPCEEGFELHILISQKRHVGEKYNYV